MYRDMLSSCAGLTINQGLADSPQKALHRIPPIYVSERAGGRWEIMSVSETAHYSALLLTRALWALVKSSALHRE
jgi:hypothetical protein